MTPPITLIFAGLVVLPWLNPFAPGPSPAVVPLLVSWFCIAVILVVASSNRQVTKRFALPDTAAWSWLVAGLVSCALGGLQFFGAANELGFWVNQTQPGEAFANLRQRNQFATLTNIALAALFWLALKANQEQKDFQTKHVGWFLSATLLVVGNGMSSSRTGLVQLVLLVALYATWCKLRNPGLRGLLLCVVVAYAVSVVAIPWAAGLDPATHGAFARLGKDDACSSRLILWSNVLTLIAQKPWLGWGWGELDYAHFITLYNGPRFCDILDNAHNLPLQLAVELGVPAALLICGVFAGWVVRQKPWAERDATRQMAWAVIALISLHSMLEYPLWYGPFQMAFGICIILLWRQKPPLNDECSLENQSNRPLALVFIRLFAIISIAFIGYAAWDYRRISQIYLEPESRSAAYRSDTLNKIRSSWLFADQVVFAELLTTPLRPVNAAWTLATAKRLLHYSPEPRVIEKLIESAVLLNQEDVALAHLARYKAAFPKEHALWAKANQKQL